MRKQNFSDMENVLNKYWICRKDMQILLPQLSTNFLDKEFNSIVKEMKDNGEPVFEHTRPVLIPIEKVIDKYHINVAYILKQAKRIGGE